MPNQQLQSNEGNTSFKQSLKDVDITKQIVAIFPQPLAQCKPESTVKCNKKASIRWQDSTPPISGGT